MMENHLHATHPVSVQTHLHSYHQSLRQLLILAFLPELLRLELARVLEPQFHLQTQAYLNHVISVTIREERHQAPADFE